MKIAINGAGIAGATLAYWLWRYGHDPVLIEKSSRLRAGGYVIDFWGGGYTIADRMGLTSELHRRGYQVREVRLVDRRGRRTGGFAADVFGRNLNAPAHHPASWRPRVNDLPPHRRTRGNRVR